MATNAKDDKDIPISERRASTSLGKPMNWGPSGRRRFNPQTSPSFQKLLDKQSRRERKGSLRGSSPTRKASAGRRFSIQEASPIENLGGRRSSCAHGSSQEMMALSSLSHPPSHSGYMRRASMTEGIVPKQLGSSGSLPELRLNRRNRLPKESTGYTSDTLIPKTPSMRSGEVSPPSIGSPVGITRRELSVVSPTSEMGKAQVFMGMEVSRKDTELKRKQDEFVSRKEHENKLADRFFMLYQGILSQKQYFDSLADALKPPDFLNEMVQMDTKDLISRLKKKK